MLLRVFMVFLLITIPWMLEGFPGVIGFIWGSSRYKRSTCCGIDAHAPHGYSEIKPGLIGSAGFLGCQYGEITVKQCPGFVVSIPSAAKAAYKCGI